MDVEPIEGVRGDVTAAWQRYLDLLEPLRPALHAYCRRLTGNVWDAEDLAQDAIVRGFGALGMSDRPVDNARGYMVRTATNIWIDTVRRRATESEAMAREARGAAEAYSPPDAGEVRDAATALLEGLAPQERAAVVMKDVFDLSLQEIAGVLGTTANAVKAALHRGRGRLRAPDADALAVRPRAASPELVDRFIERLRAADLDGLLALMLDSASVEMFPHVAEAGRRQFEAEGSWLWQSVHVHPELPPESRPPKWLNERVEFQGEQLMVSYFPGARRRVLTSVVRFEEQDGRVARIRSYQFCPETVAEVAASLGVDAAKLPYRFPARA